MSQQIINIGSAPNDGTGDQLRISFDKTNDNFSELYSGAGTSTEGIWNFNQTSTDTTTAPVSGRFRTNSGNYRDATQLAIHAITIRGIDRSNTLRRLLVGDVIECHDEANGNAWCRYVVQADPIDYTTWFQINIGLLDNGTAASADNQEVDFFFTANTNPSPGGRAEYRFSTNTSPPPGDGYIRINNASLGATTVLYVNVITNNGTDIGRDLRELTVGQELIIQDQASSANYGDYNITSAIIDQTSYIEIPVSSTGSGGSITNNTVVHFTIVGGGGGAAGGNVSNVGTPTNGQLAQWTDATHIQGIDASGLGFAPLASPAFTGNPTAPTPTAGDNDTSIATTAFVTNALATAGGSSIPQGRLTLVTGVPVMITTQAAKTTIFYTPYVGNIIPLYDGIKFLPTIFTELSVATTDTTKNPAAIGVSKVNDWFVWNDAGTLRLSHGPDWTNDTTRSAGTALVMINGILVNNASITNACAAQRGTYVGTTRSNGSSQFDWIYGTTGASGAGTAGFFGMWNTYNRVEVKSMVGDGTLSWTYNAATWRPANNSTINRHSFVSGLAEDCIDAAYEVPAQCSTTNAQIGIGLDSTTAHAANCSLGTMMGNPILNMISILSAAPMLGFHFLQAIEYNAGATGTNTFYGNAGNATAYQMGLHFAFKM